MGDGGEDEEERVERRREIKREARAEYEKVCLQMSVTCFSFSAFLLYYECDHVGVLVSV